MLDPNRQRLLEAATVLRPMLGDLVFIGGAVTGLLITDPAAGGPRTTMDVDAIVELTSYGEYATFSERLRDLGFVEDASEDAPVCRWVQGSITLDVMPLDETILGFSNHWYQSAIAHAEVLLLADDLSIRMLSSAHFVATKLTAFHGRAEGDFYSSKDLEDVVTVLNGREGLLGEIRNAPADVAEFVRQEFSALLAHPRLEDILAASMLPDETSQARIPLLINRLQKLAAG